MPKILTNFDPPEQKGVGPEPIYPWNQWFEKIQTETSKEKKKGLMLFHEKDFSCTIQTMVRAIKREATKRMVRLSIHRVPDGVVIMLVDSVP